MKNGIVIDRVSKVFGKKNIVLNNVSFQGNCGEFIVLVGPSGCGKSTMLNLIAGLESPTSGQIWIDGRNVTKLSPKSRNIAMVFQSYALYPNMNVRQNISFGLKRRDSLDATGVKNRVEKVAGSLQISDLLHRLPAELSGGQRQRVAMGRAISRKPDVYLFDEPLSNLDAKLRVEMRIEIKMLHEKEKKSIIYVTHDQVEAMTLADRIIVFHKGIIQQSGTPYEVYSKPSNMFVAGFIGSPSMSFLPVDIYGDDGKIKADLISESGEIFSIDLSFHSALLTKYLNKKVIIGVRPEYIVDQLKFTDHSLKNAANNEKSLFHKVNSLVKFVEMTGPDCFLHMRFNDHRVIARCSSKRRDNKINQLVDVFLKIELLVFFDPDTEEIITV